ncbi:MAG: hypothetical protein WBL28_08460 [Methylotenera sp.]
MNDGLGKATKKATNTPHPTKLKNNLKPPNLQTPQTQTETKAKNLKTAPPKSQKQPPNQPSKTYPKPLTKTTERKTPACDPHRIRLTEAHE